MQVIRGQLEGVIDGQLDSAYRECKDRPVWSGRGKFMSSSQAEAEVKAKCWPLGQTMHHDMQALTVPRCLTPSEGMGII